MKTPKACVRNFRNAKINLQDVTWYQEYAQNRYGVSLSDSKFKLTVAKGAMDQNITVTNKAVSAKGRLNVFGEIGSLRNWSKGAELDIHVTKTGKIGRIWLSKGGSVNLTDHGTIEDIMLTGSSRLTLTGTDKDIPVTTGKGTYVIETACPIQLRIPAMTANVTLILRPGADGTVVQKDFSSAELTVVNESGVVYTEKGGQYLQYVYSRDKLQAALKEAAATGFENPAVVYAGNDTDQTLPGEDLVIPEGVTLTFRWGTLYADADNRLIIEGSLLTDGYLGEGAADYNSESYCSGTVWIDRPEALELRGEGTIRSEKQKNDGQNGIFAKAHSVSELQAYLESPAEEMIVLEGDFLLPKGIVEVPHEKSLQVSAGSRLTIPSGATLVVGPKDISPNPNTMIVYGDLLIEKGGTLEMNGYLQWIGYQENTELVNEGMIEGGGFYNFYGGKIQGTGELLIVEESE